MRSCGSVPGQLVTCALGSCARGRELARVVQQPRECSGHRGGVARLDHHPGSEVPDDLAAALEAAGLTDAFAQLSRQSRYSILHRVQTAKKAETRQRRIAKYVAMLAAGETPHTGG